MLNKAIDAKGDDREVVIGEMAEAAGIDKNTVYQILRGEINCPPKKRLSGFADVLNISLRTLTNAAKRDGCSYE